jgi:hypothetical protein
MTHDHSALLAQLDALKSADAGAVFAELIRAGLQTLIEAEATEKIGAGRYQRCQARTTERNGHRPKTVATTSGDIEVKDPQAAGGVVLPVALVVATGVSIRRHTREVKRFNTSGLVCGSIPSAPTDVVAGYRRTWYRDLLLTVVALAACDWVRWPLNGYASLAASALVRTNW